MDCSAFIFRVILHYGYDSTSVRQGTTDARTQHHARQQTLGSHSNVPNWTKSLYSLSLPIHSDCLNGCLKPLLHAYSRKLQLMLIGSGYQPQLPAECYTTC